MGKVFLKYYYYCMKRDCRWDSGIVGQRKKEIKIGIVFKKDH